MQKFLPIKKSIFIVCLAMMLCWIPVTAHAAGHREAPTSPTRILFVGNSYTQRNHMPNIFRKLCKNSGQNVIVRSLTNPGRSLKNTSNPTTANGRKLYRLLRMQRWDYVILQDRRYYPISKPQRMKRTIRKLAPYIQASGAKMVLYQTWAPGKWHNDYNRYDSVSNRSDYQSILNRTIAEIAEEHNALVAPVGTAFLLCSHSSYGIKLLMGDYSHPTAEGSYLAACVIYNTVFSRSSMGIPYTGTLDVMTAFKLQKLAETVCFAS